MGQACKALRLELGYSDSDARTVALNNIESFVFSAQMTLNLLDSWAIGDKIIREAIPQLIGLTTVNAETVQRSGDILNKAAKLGFLTLTQFQIENLLRNVGRYLGVASLNDGFYRTAAKVLDELSIDPVHLDELNVAARLRNSLHANGIHHRQHKDELQTIVIDRVEYTFIDGKPVHCAAWEHIAHVFGNSILILEKVLKHETVMAINDPLRDDYAYFKDLDLQSI